MMISIFKKIQIRDIERRIVTFVKNRRYRIIVYTFMVLVASQLSKVPYINIFFDSYSATLFSVLVAPVVLDANEKILLTCGVFSLFVPLFWMLTGQGESAEIAVNYIYCLILGGVLKGLFSREES